MHHNPNPQPTQKSTQISYILQKALTDSPHESTPPAISQRRHLIRCIFIAIDMTDSMHIRDFKPTRLAVCIDMVKRMVRSVRDRAPLCKFVIAKVENQLCKPMMDFLFGNAEIMEILDGLKLSHNAGFFSLQNTLSVALDYFQQIPSTYHKQLLILQSSPFTKDHRDIYKTMQTFKESKITIKIGSLAGSTYIFQKLVETCHGQYTTISTQKEFQEFIDTVAENPVFDVNTVAKKLVRMSLGRREVVGMVGDGRKVCMCHYQTVQEYFVCGVCGAVLCEKMPIQCKVCMTILVFPSDLYRHRN